MKRRILIGFVAFIFAFCGVVTASSINGMYKGNPVVKVKIDGVEVKPSGVPGYLEDGYTMVPLGLLRSMGFTVEWEQSTLTANVIAPVRTVPVLLKSQLDELAKSVYMVYGSTNDPNTVNQGSGFIIGNIFITAKHVAGYSEYVDVWIDGKQQRIKQYTASPNIDAMWFKVNGGNSLTYETELPQVGDPVYSIGFPSGELSITEGEVLGVYPSNSVIKQEGTTTFYSGKGIKIHHSAKTAPGSSGGILLNGRGNVIGINISGGLGLGGSFAQSIQEVMNEITP